MGEKLLPGAKGELLSLDPHAPLCNLSAVLCCPACLSYFASGASSSARSRLSWQPSCAVVENPKPYQKW